MKLLIFTDTHGSKKAMESVKKKAKKADVLVCMGDLSVFEHGLEESLEELHKMKKPVVLIHGNHESEEAMEFLCAPYENIHFIHKGVLLYEHVAFLGYGGGGFATYDKRFEKLMKKMMKEVPPEKKKVVLMLHQPPYGCKVDEIVPGEYVGNKSFTKVLKNSKRITHAFCGHIHECFKKKDKVGKVEVINPGPHGMIITV